MIPDANRNKSLSVASGRQRSQSRSDAAIIPEIKAIVIAAISIIFLQRLRQETTHARQ